jgi:hypothetical protein
VAESADPQVRAFHQLIENGDLEQLRAALAGDAAVNAPGHCGATALMVAIAAQDLEKVRLLLEAGADPELTDDFNRTALHVAVQHDFAGAVRLLLNLGVDRGYAPKYPLKQVLLDFPWKPAPLPDEMKGCFTEEEWLESQRATQESIRDLGLHPAVEPVIKDASSLAVLHLLLEAGDDLNLASQEMKRALVGLDTNETIECSEQDYRQHKTRRFGRRNPERMDNPFWRGMIRSGGSGYTARSQFGDTESLDEPVWCFDRFGSSLTPKLPASTKTITTPISASTTMWSFTTAAATSKSTAIRRKCFRRPIFTRPRWSGTGSISSVPSATPISAAWGTRQSIACGLIRGR